MGILGGVKRQASRAAYNGLKQQCIISSQFSGRNKTQRQLCKRLAGPFIPFSWSCLVWKRVLLWIWSLGGSQQPFFCVFGHFQHGDEQTNKRTNNRVILVQACPWPVWEGSLLQYDDMMTIIWGQDGKDKLPVWYAFRKHIICIVESMIEPS